MVMDSTQEVGTVPGSSALAVRLGAQYSTLRAGRGGADPHAFGSRPRSVSTAAHSRPASAPPGPHGRNHRKQWSRRVNGAANAKISAYLNFTTAERTNAPRPNGLHPQFQGADRWATPSAEGTCGF